MEHDRHTIKPPRTNAIADSIAYTAAIARLYAGNFDAWRLRMGRKKQLGLWQDARKEVNPIK
jgi:hypothetical protein